MSIDVAEREQVALDDLTVRLAETFDRNHTADQVRSCVVKAHHRFDGCPIRDFVPVLVERIVRAELALSTS